MFGCTSHKTDTNDAYSDTAVSEVNNTSCKPIFDSADNNYSKKEIFKKNQREQQILANIEPTFCLAPQAGNSYEASNLIDGDTGTAWAVPLDKGGIDADVIDWLKFNLTAKYIGKIVITNGYAKNEQSYFNNARGRSILISRVPWEEAEDEDILFCGELKDSPKPQTLQVSKNYNNSKPTKNIYIMFESDYYKGRKYNDFCISEIEFWGY